MRFFTLKIFLLFFIYGVYAPIVYSQDTLDIQIKWLPPVPSWFKADSTSGKVLFNFQGSKHNMLGTPVFTELIPVDENCSKVVVKILSFNVDTISDIDSYSHIADIPEEISVSAHILKENKRNFVQISVIPVIRQNGRVIRLKNFNLELIKTRSYTIKKSATSRWANSSVLNSGTWRKMAVTKTGVYKITYSEIKNLGFTNPSDVKIYGNGGKMLSERYTGKEPDDLLEIPIYLSKGSDDIFNEGDYLIFYATGPISWTYDTPNRKFIHSKHYFTDKSYYFISSGENGLKITDSDPVVSPEDLTIASFVDYDVHEENLNNPIKSGRNWIGEKFENQTSRNFAFSFPDPVENSNFTIEGEVLARSALYTNFIIKYNNQLLKNQSMNNVNLGDEASNHADAKSFTASGSISGKDVNINIMFEKNGDISAEGWLNYLRLNVKRKLKLQDNQLLFRDTTALYQNKTAMFQVETAGSGLLVWDVTDLNNTRNISTTTSGTQLSFKTITDTLREFVVFDPSKALLVPDFLTESEKNVANQNLHALSNFNMVIISHPNFLAQAEELAEIHRNNDNLTVIIVTPDQIYNEFSSGNPDPAAYRNFMKALYDRATQPNDMPRYLLLFGDGSYKNFTDNTSQNKTDNTNFILTYQSANSIREVSSYVSDDYFGLLDDNEGIESGLLDLGIGRFPVSTTEQANGIINKIKKYISASSKGNWRNDICFIADDEDGNIHMSQADQLATYVENNHPSYNPVKIFSDAYPQVTMSTGPRYPEVNKAIENTMNKGVLIMNYTGHGGETGLAHEQIIRQVEVKSWGNDKYPLFVTATCEFSRFDNYEQTTAGEDVLLNPNGGGIGLLTTTRLVYSGPNFVLNQQFYKNFAQKDADGNYYHLGDILKRTKNASGTDINKLCFTLLGDPALCLAYPKMLVQTTQINSQDVENLTDTLKAYMEVSVKGMITDQPGNMASDFNGTIYPTLFDKAQVVKSLSNDNGDPFNFKQKESILYKGKATVKNGEFEFSFVVPREIAYNFGNGRFSYYASGTETDASGYFDKFVIGGISAGTSTDNEGPLIDLFLNDKFFRNGGISNQNPTLLADLSDDNGINISGTSIGHNIVAIVDNNSANSFILNNYFEAQIDDYRNGTIVYKLPKLEPGKHTLSLKAWDIFNNSTTAEIAFEVIDSSNLVVKNLYNFPNPFSGSTTFVFEHNQPGKNLDAELQIFTMTGKMITSQRMSILSEGFSSGPILWDGNNNNYKKPEKGIYIYRFVFRYNGTEILSESKKMVVVE